MLNTYKAGGGVVRSVMPLAAVRDGSPYLRDESLIELFDQTADLFADHIALRLVNPGPGPTIGTGEQLLTYAELRSRSHAWAERLASLGVTRGERVAILLPRGLEQFVAVLAVLRLGACYVPIDWSYPQDRVDFIVRDSNATAVVTTATRAAHVGLPALIVEDAPSPTLEIPQQRAASTGEPEDLAYIVYTSGSTGRPKGVMVTQRNACHFVRSEGAILALDPSDRVFSASSLAFDMSVEGMWSAWFVGAELLVASEAMI